MGILQVEKGKMCVGLGWKRGSKRVKTPYSQFSMMVETRAMK
jgi:hypothetical protein